MAHAVSVTRRGPTGIAGRAASVPPHAYFVLSAVFHSLGPAFAVLLFARVDVLGVAWLRIVSAGLIFAAWRRPWRAFLRLDRSSQALIVGLGAVFALMNVCFYVSIDRLPLATVSSIEFIGPISLAAIGARSGRNIVAVAAAMCGVFLLTHIRVVGDPFGVAFAFANAVLFTLYIVLAHRVARRSPMGAINSLAAAMLFAMIFVSPIGLAQAAHAFTDPLAIAAAIGIGVSSSVIPYVLDQLAMARLPRSTYALFLALLPATATVIGVIVLHQFPALTELAGIGLVMAGVALHRAPSDGDQGSMPAHVEVSQRCSEAAGPGHDAVDVDLGRTRCLPDFVAVPMGDGQRP